MKELTIRGRILAGFGIILLAIMAVGSFSYTRLVSVERELNILKTSALPVLHTSGQLRQAIADDYAITVRLGYEADPKTEKIFEDVLKEQEAKTDRLLAEYASAASSSRDRRDLTEVRRAIQGYSNARAMFLRTSAPASDGQAISLRITKEIDPSVLNAITVVEAAAAASYQRGVTAAKEIYSHLYWLRIVAAVSVFAVILVAFTSGIFLLRAITVPLKRLTGLMDVMRQGDFTQRMETARRDEFGILAEGFNRMADEVMGLVGEVQKSGIRVSTSMTEIAATSKQQQATASEVAATTTQIGATSREISATSRELVRTMNEVSVVAEHAAGLAGSGQSGLSHMEETMGQVMEAAGSINARLAVLNEKAGNITQVVTTITKVADQTNLLSLNAAIEAEKAGEYGRGFAVVSSEIRRLADQTAIATYDIEQMVKEIQTAVSAGVMGMDKFSEEVRRGMHDIHEIGGKLSEIIAQVQALVPRFETVNEGMQAQATGAEQISEALLQLTESTQQTVESLRQSSSALDELNQVSGNLHGSISRFKLAAA